jgi:hypothetical protein
MGFFNKIEDETKNLLSNVDDGVNDTIGWEGVAALVAMMMGMPTGTFGGSSASAAGGSTGFSFLPSGEMTVFSPETAGATGGNSNFLSSLFGGGGGASGTFTPDLSGLSTYGDIGIDPTTSAFDSSMGTYDPASKYYDLGSSSSLLDSLLSKQKQQSMPNFGNQMQQQAAQQLAQLNQGDDFGMGMRKGQAIPQAILSSLLDPSVALKAYRPTLI